MAGGDFEPSMLEVQDPDVADVQALLEMLQSEGLGSGNSSLDSHRENVEIEIRSSTTVGIRAPSGSRAKEPAVVHVDGRIGIATADPTPVTISGGPGTKYIYADVDSAGAITLAFSTTAPGAESTPYRRALGQCEWSGTAITSVTSYTGNTPPDGSITSAKLAAGSVTTAAIGNGQVTDAKLAAGKFPRNYLGGFNLVNNGSTAINFGAGACRSQNDDGDMVLAATLVGKSLNSTWAVGASAGGLDTGSKANNTWYHCHIIKRPDTGVVDALFSLSATAPTLPANYTMFRRVGSIRTDGSGNILGFIQRGDSFQWTTAILDVNVTTPGNTAVLRALTVPSGVVVTALINLLLDPNSTAAFNCYVSDPTVTDMAPSTTAAPLVSCIAPTTTGQAAVQMTCRTDASSQVRTRCSTNLGVKLLIATLGWYDLRGRG